MSLNNLEGRGNRAAPRFRRLKLDAPHRGVSGLASQSRIHAHLMGTGGPGFGSSPWWLPDHPTGATTPPYRVGGGIEKQHCQGVHDEYEQETIVLLCNGRPLDTRERLGPVADQHHV